MKIGYARISTQDQNLELQIDALEKSGCGKIFTDKASGTDGARQGLLNAIEFCRENDSLVVWKLDRLGRSLKQLIETINMLHERKISFVSLQENIDTTTSGGKLIFHVFGALAEFERELIRERTNAGLSSARARGRLGGRPRVMNEKQINLAKSMLANSNIQIKDICEIIGVSKTTFYRYIK